MTEGSPAIRSRLTKSGDTLIAMQRYICIENEPHAVYLNPGSAIGLIAAVHDFEA